MELITLIADAETIYLRNRDLKSLEFKFKWEKRQKYFDLNIPCGYYFRDIVNCDSI